MNHAEVLNSQRISGDGCPLIEDRKSKIANWVLEIWCRVTGFGESKIKADIGFQISDFHEANTKNQRTEDGRWSTEDGGSPYAVPSTTDLVGVT